jgi:hypothetical protein
MVESGPTDVMGTVGLVRTTSKAGRIRSALCSIFWL